MENFQELLPMTEFPNYFNSVSSNFDENLYYFDSEPTLRFLQIGVYTGDVSVYLLDRASFKEDFILVDVDTWSRGDSKEMGSLDFTEIEAFYLQRTSGERKLGRCQPHKTTSDLFFAKNNEKFNFIYIDGNHEPTQVLKDGLNAFDALIEDGILAFDDYLGATDKSLDQRPKVAIDLLLQLLGGKVEIVLDNNQLWMRKKLIPSR